jgi:hypothetical protein
MNLNRSAIYCVGSSELSHTQHGENADFRFPASGNGAIACVGFASKWKCVLLIKFIGNILEEVYIQFYYYFFHKCYLIMPFVILKHNGKYSCFIDCMSVCINKVHVRPFWRYICTKSHTCKKPCRKRFREIICDDKFRQDWCNHTYFVLL